MSSGDLTAERAPAASSEGTALPAGRGGASLGLMSESQSARTPGLSRAAFNARMDNQLAMAERAGKNITAPAFLHLHMEEVRRGAAEHLASRDLETGDPQVRFSDGAGAFLSSLWAGFDGDDTAARVTRLRGWVAPADLYALVDRNRAIFESGEAQGGRAADALDYAHGPAGPAAWNPAVAIAVGSAIEARLRTSLAHVSAQLVAATASARAANTQVRARDLVPGHPLDWQVAQAMLARGGPTVEVVEGALAVAPGALVAYRKIRAIEWQGARGGPWNAARILDPPDAGPEEVAADTLGSPTEAYQLVRVGPFYLFPEADAARFPAARAFRGLTADGAVDGLAFGISASIVETAEVERGLGAAPGVAPAAEELEREWHRIQGQLAGLAMVVRPYGLDAALGAAQARHAAHRADLATLAGRDAIVRGALFTGQHALLARIAVEIGALVAQVEGRAGTATPAADDPAVATLRLLVRAASLAHLPETGAAALASVHDHESDAVQGTLENALAEAATQLAIARALPGQTSADTIASRRAFGVSLAERATALRQRIADLRTASLGGHVDPAEIKALYAEIDALKMEAGLIAQAGQLKQLFDIVDKLEDSNWVAFSEWLTGGDDRLEDLRSGAFQLRADLHYVHAKMLQLREAGGADVEAMRARLTQSGQSPDVRAFLRHAYDTIDSAQTRAMVVQIASMIGIAVVSGGAGAVAEGAALGAGAGVLAANLVGLAVDTATFTALEARLSGDPIVHAFANNFLGNFTTFAAVKGVEAAVAGSAIGRTLAAAKAGERVGKLALWAARAGEITAPVLVTAGVQFALAEAHSLAAKGRTLSMDELATTAVQGMAMMIGAVVTHKVLEKPLAEARAFGAGQAARLSNHLRLERLAARVQATGDPAEALALLHESRAYVDEEIARFTALEKLPANELKSRGLSAPVVKALGERARAHRDALDRVSEGAIAAQLGLDTYVPGRIYGGDRAAVARVVESYRAAGYRVEAEPGGYRVTREGDPRIIHLFEHDAVEELAPVEELGIEEIGPEDIHDDPDPTLVEDTDPWEPTVTDIHLDETPRVRAPGRSQPPPIPPPRPRKLGRNMPEFAVAESTLRAVEDPPGSMELVFEARTLDGERVKLGDGHVDLDASGQPNAAPDFTLDKSMSRGGTEYAVRIYPDVRPGVAAPGERPVPVGVGETVSLTAFALKKLLELYRARFGHDPDMLYGYLAWENRKAFQREFVKNRRTMGEEEAAKAAMLAIPFGRHRADIGYDEFDVKMENYWEDELGVDPITGEDLGKQRVPHVVRVEATKGKKKP